VLLTQEDRMRHRLQQRHWLRLHAVLTAGLGLGAMGLLSLALLHAGLHSMALRYGVVLACGYLLYLGLVRLWAGCMLRRDGDVPDGVPDLPGTACARGPAQPAFESGQGGSFGGGGAGGSWEDGEALSETAAAASDVASRGLELPGLDSLDEGAVVVVPVLLLFAALLIAVTGAGSLLWLVFGADLFLAVAVEVAFALLMARTLYVVEREGWLLVALRMSWKPVLGALATAVAFGALADWMFPQADTLVQVLAALRAR
jgi:uncharacterized membrane protein YgcG